MSRRKCTSLLNVSVSHFHAEQMWTRCKRLDKETRVAESRTSEDGERLDEKCREHWEQAEHTVVAPHKRIAVAAPHLAVNKLPRSLKCDVHVAVDGLELAYRVKEERDVSECVLCKLPRSSSFRPESGLQRLTLVDNTRVELDCHWCANDLAEETGRVAGIVCCWGGGGGGAVGSWGGHFRGVFLVVWMDLIGWVLCFFCVFSRVVLLF